MYVKIITVGLDHRWWVLSPSVYVLSNRRPRSWIIYQMKFIAMKFLFVYRTHLNKVNLKNFHMSSVQANLLQVYLLNYLLNEHPVLSNRAHTM